LTIVRPLFKPPTDIGKGLVAYWGFLGVCFVYSDRNKHQENMKKISIHYQYPLVV